MASLHSCPVSLLCFPVTTVSPLIAEMTAILGWKSSSGSAPRTATHAQPSWSEAECLEHSPWKPGGRVGLGLIILREMPGSQRWAFAMELSVFKTPGHLSQTPIDTLCLCRFRLPALGDTVASPGPCPFSCREILVWQPWRLWPGASTSC